jgi:WD40 repeat protein
VKLWSVKGGQLLATLKGHAGKVTLVAFAPDGQTLASGSYNEKTRQGEIILRFAATEAEMERQPNNDQSSVLTICYSMGCVRSSATSIQLRILLMPLSRLLISQRHTQRRAFVV